MPRVWQRAWHYRHALPRRFPDRMPPQTRYSRRVDNFLRLPARSEVCGVEKDQAAVAPPPVPKIAHIEHSRINHRSFGKLYAGAEHYAAVALNGHPVDGTAKLLGGESLVGRCLHGSQDGALHTSQSAAHTCFHLKKYPAQRLVILSDAVGLKTTLISRPPEGRRQPYVATRSAQASAAHTLTGCQRNARRPRTPLRSPRLQRHEGSERGLELLRSGT